MFTRLFICVLLQAMTTSVFGADEAGNYAIWGVGRSSCHQFLKSAGGESRDRYKLFLMGYLTAFNTLREDTYNATGSNSLDVSLDQISDYCEQHQMDSFDRAIQQLLDGLYESRQRVPPGSARGWGHPAPGAASEQAPQ